MKKSKFIFFLALASVNLLFVNFLKISITLLDVLIIHIFLFTLSFLAERFQIKFSKNKNITPSHFLTINFIRMLLCIIFLLPIILKYDKSHNIYIYNFFMVYFFYLFLDLFFKYKNFNEINT
jgi:hypothetical protein